MFRYGFFSSSGFSEPALSVQSLKVFWLVTLFNVLSKQAASKPVSALLQNLSFTTYLSTNMVLYTRKEYGAVWSF